MGKTYDIKCNSNVNSLLITVEESMKTAVRQLHTLIAVSKGPREDVDTLPAHLSSLSNPEVIPKGIVCGVGYSSIEADLYAIPSL